MRASKNILSVGILAIFALLAVGSGDSGSGGSSSPQPQHDKISAYTMCEKFVKDRLKAPSTAKFPWGASDYTTDLGGGTYRVQAYVDAQNSFGAMLRTRFDCTVRWTGGDMWQLQSLTIE